MPSVATVTLSTKIRLFLFARIVIFDELVNVTFSPYGFKANATNGFYYDLLKMFDIEVIEVKELKA